MKKLRSKDLSWSRRRLAPRQHAFLQGDDNGQIYRVQSGYLRLYVTLSDGRRQIIGFKSTGDIVGLDAGSTYRYGAQAISTTEVHCIPATEFFAFARGEPDVLIKLFGLVCADLSLAHDLLVTIGKRDAEESMASFLLDAEARAAERGAKGDFISLPMLHGDLADYLGLTSETVSRIFTNFKKRGLIEVRGRHGVRLTNRRALRALAKRHPSKRDE